MTIELQSVLVGYCRLVGRAPDRVTVDEVLLYLEAQSNEVAEEMWKRRYGKEVVQADG